MNRYLKNNVRNTSYDWNKTVEGVFFCVIISSFRNFFWKIKFCCGIAKGFVLYLEQSDKIKFGAVGLNVSIYTGAKESEAQGGT